MSDSLKEAAQLHSRVPADHYARSIKESPLHRFWHTRRFEEIGKMIRPTGGKILDIGSSDGTFTKVIIEKTCAEKVFGIDVLEKSVSYAKRRFARSKIASFLVADAHNLP
ncbi:MAG: class I SAM-dependent methyltransferase, partial [Patescibacteria group bacterium]